MAETYTALLFSIGIANGKRLIMAEWRDMMLEVGLQNPRTLIATGNAIFESDEKDVRKLELQLEDAFERRFGRRVDTIVRPAVHFRKLPGNNPFAKEAKRDGASVMVRVMREPLPKKTTADLARYLTRGERAEIVRGDLWMHFQGRSNESRIWSVLSSKRLGVGTVRNWNTVVRLNEMLDPA